MMGATGRLRLKAQPYSFSFSIWEGLYLKLTNPWPISHHGCFLQMHAFQPVVEALEKRYHKDCFRCAKCQGAVPEKFHAESGRPWCDSCYQEKLEASSPVCNDCNKPITKGTRLEVAGKTFHEACFKDAAWGQCNACQSKVLLKEVRCVTKYS